MIRFRWLFLIFFLVWLVASVGIGLSTGGTESRGWLAATVVSAFALAYVVWGDSRPAPVRPLAVPVPEPVPIAVPVPPATVAERPSPFEEYFERAPIPLVVVDRDGCIKRMNQAAESVTEFAAAEVCSLPYWDIFLGEDQREIAARDYREALLARQAPVRREAWKTRTGLQARFEWWRTILKDEWGQGFAVLAAALPETVESAPMDLTALTDQLTAVNGYSEFLLQSMTKEHPMRDDLESIHRAGMAASGVLAPRTSGL